MKFDGWPKKTIERLFYTTSRFVHHFETISKFKLELQSKNAQNGPKASIFFCFVWPWNLMNDIKNNRTPILYYIKPCTSFQSHGWIQSGATVWKRSIRVKIGDFFLYRVTLKFYKWPRETSAHVFYATSSFVHRFKAIGEFKLELQSGIAKFGSKSTNFLAVWLWNLADDLENT